MFCITLHMPWAFWVMMKWKTVETRLHRRFKKLEGETIGIHAGLHWAPDAMKLADAYLTEEEKQITRSINPDRYFGRILCTVKVLACEPLTKERSRWALIDCDEKHKRYGLSLYRIQELEVKPKTRGYQGIWEYEMAA